MRHALHRSSQASPLGRIIPIDPKRYLPTLPDAISADPALQSVLAAKLPERPASNATGCVAPTCSSSALCQNTKDGASGGSFSRGWSAKPARRARATSGSARPTSTPAHLCSTSVTALPVSRPSAGLSKTTVTRSYSGSELPQRQGRIQALVGRPQSPAAASHEPPKQTLDTGPPPSVPRTRRRLISPVVRVDVPALPRRWECVI